MTVNPSSVYFPVTRITEEGVMNYVKRILQAISILLAVASFLLNAGRALKAIEFEAWFLLNNKALSIENNYSNSFNKQSMMPCLRLIAVLAIKQMH